MDSSISFPFATVEDLRDRWPGMPAGSEGTARVLLEDASGVILDTVPSAQNARPDTLRRIVCSMVRRAMNVPDEFDGVSQMSETVGGVSQSVTPINGGADLYLTKAEKAALSAGAGGSRAFGFEVAEKGRVRHLPWCNLMWGALYCSCGTDIAGRPIFEGTE